MGSSFRISSTTTRNAHKNWLVESILVTLFCCLPFGIAGVVYASQVLEQISGR